MQYTFEAESAETFRSSASTLLSFSAKSASFTVSAARKLRRDGHVFL